MPPRNAAGGQGQAKARVVAAPKAPARAYEVKEEITECPLCVEPLDQTDQAFQPCPCGYLVCLFCYHKLKDLCNGLCPNCRKEYGSAQPVEVSVVSDIARDAEVTSRHNQTTYSHPAPPAGARAGAGLAGGGNGMDVQHNAAGTAAATAAARAAQAATAATTARPVQQAGGVPAAARRGENGATGPGRGGRADDAPALPSGATWATQAGPRLAPEPPAPPAPPAAPIIADASAWPDLAAAQAAPPPPPVRAPPRERAPVGAGAGQGDGPAAHQPPAPAQAQQQHQQQPQQHPQPPLPQQQHPQQHHTVHGNGGAHAPSQATNHPHMAHAHVLQPQMPQRVSPMTQDPVVSPEQLPFGPGPNGMQVLGYQNVQVSTHAFGSTRTIGVTLPNGGPQPELHPEAQAMRAHLEQALHAGKLTTQQASQQLLALLQHPDMSAAGRPPQRPPPGFGGPPASHGAHANGGPLFSAADSQVPPISRMQPIGTPIGPPPGIQHPQQQQQYPQQVQPGLQGNGNGRYVNGATKPAPGMYNLWGGALPGIDLAAGYGVQGKPMAPGITLNGWLAGGGGGGGGGMDGMHAGALGMGFHGFHGGPGVPQQGGPAKPPPPGFAAVPQAYQQHMMQPNGMQDPVAAAPQHHGDQGGPWYQSGTFSFNNQAPGMGNGPRGPPPGMSAYRPQQLGTGA